ncbi:hypothetical protein C6W19_23305 [Bacillus sp. RJGP41]|nr:hypothetical protein C6W19_23305 [Bacillus sp. RJGP41]
MPEVEINVQICTSQKKCRQTRFSSSLSTVWEDHNKWSSFCFPSTNLFGEGIDIYLMGTIRDSGFVIRTAEYSITRNFKLFHNRIRDFLMLMKTKRRGKYITMKHTM